MTLKNKVEALLFSAGKNMDVTAIATTIGESEDAVLEELKKLKEEYNNRNCALRIIDEGSKWKIHVKEQYLDLVRKIVADTELPMPVLETLAVIAQKHPALQSEVVNTRGVSAYEHMPLLIEMGFITKEKFGRSFKIKLTEKFFEYFEIEGEDDIRKLFANVKAPERKVEEQGSHDPRLDLPDFVPVKASDEDKESIARLRDELAERTSGLKDVAGKIRASSDEMGGFKPTEREEDDMTEQEYTAYSSGEEAPKTDIAPSENGEVTVERDQEYSEENGSEGIQVEATEEAMNIYEGQESQDVKIDAEETETVESDEQDAPVTEGEDDIPIEELVEEDSVDEEPANKPEDEETAEEEPKTQDEELEDDTEEDKL